MWKPGFASKCTYKMRQRENLISVLSPNQSLRGSGSETTGRWGSNSSTEIQMDLYHPVSSAPHSSCTTHNFHTNNTLNNFHKDTEWWSFATFSSLFWYADIKSKLFLRVNHILHLCMISCHLLCGNFLTCPYVRTYNIYWTGPQERFSS